MPKSRLRRFVSLTCLFSCWCIAEAHARDLTFEERVRAQEAIERVYYSHQLDSTLPFEEAVPRAVLEKEVSTYLRKSEVLD